MGMMSEFRAFAMRGNVVDMAVGVIVGGAFGKIVSSLVGDVVMPPLGLLLGNADFSALALTLKEATGQTDAVTLNYGKFIQTVVDFLIIAFSVFVAVRMMNSVRKKEAEAPASPPAPTREEELLGEIRDLLKKRE